MSRTQVVEETGALPDADDVDMTDKFAPPSGKEDEMMTFVEDRFFNDLRYHINSDRLFELGW